jgi:hypothetical protein
MPTVMAQVMEERSSDRSSRPESSAERIQPVITRPPSQGIVNYQL